MEKTIDDDEDIDDYKRMKIERSEFGNPVYTRLRENQSYFGKSDIEKTNTLSISHDFLSSIDPDQKKVKLNTIVSVAMAIADMPDLVSARDVK